MDLYDTTEENQEENTKNNKKTNLKKSSKKQKLMSSETQEDKINKNKIKHSVKGGCQLSCFRKCESKIDPEQRILINEKFWGMNLNDRKTFIFYNANSQNTSRKTTGSNESRRKRTIKYQLKNNDGSLVNVCKSFFLNTLGFSNNSDSIIRDVLNSEVVSKKSKNIPEKLLSKTDKSYVKNKKTQISNLENTGLIQMIENQAVHQGMHKLNYESSEIAEVNNYNPQFNHSEMQHPCPLVVENLQVLKTDAEHQYDQIQTLEPDALNALEINHQVIAYSNTSALNPEDQLQRRNSEIEPSSAKDKEHLNKQSITFKKDKKKQIEISHQLTEKEYQIIEKNKTKHPIKRGCHSNCPRKCETKFDFKQRLLINNQFWEMNRNDRRSFIFYNANSQNTSRKTTNSEESRRKRTIVYQLKNKDGTLVKVCKSFFLNTLGFSSKSNSMIRGVLNFNIVPNPKHKDNRGGKKLNREIIKAHVETFNPITQNQGRYLSMDLNVKDMHKDFRLKYPELKCSYETYRKVIQSEMKISFVKLVGHKDSINSL